MKYTATWNIMFTENTFVLQKQLSNLQTIIKFANNYQTCKQLSNLQTIIKLANDNPSKL